MAPVLLPPGTHTLSLRLPISPRRCGLRRSLLIYGSQLVNPTSFQWLSGQLGGPCTCLQHVVHGPSPCAAWPSLTEMARVLEVSGSSSGAVASATFVSTLSGGCSRPHRPPSPSPSSAAAVLQRRTRFTISTPTPLTSLPPPPRPLSPSFSPASGIPADPRTVGGTKTTPMRTALLSPPIGIGIGIDIDINIDIGVDICAVRIRPVSPSPHRPRRTAPGIIHTVTCIS
ncbi:hypothetical protein V8D89_008556 [Ganoderma adspersum]